MSIVSSLRSRLVQFASSNPDEEALVHGAACLGVILAHRSTQPGGVQRTRVAFGGDGRSSAPPLLAGGGGAPSSLTASSAKRVWVSDTLPSATYDVLACLEFSSERKRMSVLVQCVHAEVGSEPGGSAGPGFSSGAVAAPGSGLWLVTKGADDVILPRLSVDTTAARAVLDATQSSLESFAAVGLRTLVVAARQVPSHEWIVWKEEWDAAHREVGASRAAAVSRACDRIEVGLSLLGATAIEDKLQDGVPRAIASLKDAGVAVWMLTGDKSATAVQVARAAQLIGGGCDHENKSSSSSSSSSSNGLPLHIRTFCGSTFNEVEAELVAAEAAWGTGSGGGGYAVNTSPAAMWMNSNSSPQQQQQQQQHYHRGVGSGGGGVRGGPPPPTTPHKWTSATAAADADYDGGSSLPVGGRGGDDFSIAVSPSPTHHRGHGGKHDNAEDDSRELVIVVEGAALRHLLAATSIPAAAVAVNGVSVSPSTATDVERRFLSLALRCSAVIACRCTPAQKAALAGAAKAAGRGGGQKLNEHSRHRVLRHTAFATKARRRRDNVVVAIGDGGNDVAMIQAADVGVGIAGREGQQAARAADVALACFAHLPRLLFVHGRLAHHRSALVTQYTVHKSMALCFLQLAFNTSCAASGCSLLDTVSLTAYNLILTSIPSALMVLDADRSPDALMAQPRFFSESQGNTWLTRKTFFAWSSRAVIQAGVIFGITSAALGGGGGDAGSSADQTILASAAFTAMVLLQAITVYTEMYRPSWRNALASVTSILIHILLLAFPPTSTSLGVMSTLLFSHAAPLAAITLAVVVAAGPWLTNAAVRQVFGGVRGLVRGLCPPTAAAATVVAAAAATVAAARATLTTPPNGGVGGGGGGGGGAGGAGGRRPTLSLRHTLATMRNIVAAAVAPWRGRISRARTFRPWEAGSGLSPGGAGNSGGGGGVESSGRSNGARNNSRRSSSLGSLGGGGGGALAGARLAAAAMEDNERGHGAEGTLTPMLPPGTGSKARRGK